jgi:hypothetical protein
MWDITTVNTTKPGTTGPYHIFKNLIPENYTNEVASDSLYFCKPKF